MTIKKIACSTDFSPNAEIAFSAALDAAEKYNASLHVIHVFPQPVNPMLADFEIPLLNEPLIQNTEEFQKSLVMQMEEKMAERFAGRMSHLKDSKLVILNGHVSTEIINYLKENDIDLVVLGSYGYTGMGLVLFGSVAKRVAHKAHCSVLIARDKNENC